MKLALFDCTHGLIALLDPVITKPTWTAVVFDHPGFGEAMKVSSRITGAALSAYDSPLSPAPVPWCFGYRSDPATEVRLPDKRVPRYGNESSDLTVALMRQSGGNTGIPDRSRLMGPDPPYSGERVLAYHNRMAELVFEVIQEGDGGYCAECLTENIFTEGDTWDELRKNVLEATTAFFFDRSRPDRIRLHLVRDEILSMA
jgi:hypothetical protein